MFFVFALAFANLEDVCENSRAGATLDLRSRASTDLLSSTPSCNTFSILDYERGGVCHIILLFMSTCTPGLKEGIDYFFIQFHRIHSNTTLSTAKPSSSNIKCG